MPRALSIPPVMSWLVMSCMSLVAFAGGPPPSDRPAVSPVDLPWVAPGDVSPAFTPDGRTVYFTRRLGARLEIMVSSLRGRSWTAPVVAPFSGEWLDIEPAMAPDGSYLVFVSNRPATPGGRPLDGTFGGQLHPGRGGNLWRVDLRGARTVAERLPDVINRDSSTYGPAVGRDGTVYFMGHGSKGGKSRLYAARFSAGRFLVPEPLPFSDETTMDCDPAIARDGSFLVFSSGRAPTPANQRGSGLFISRAVRGGWSTPISLGIFGQEARLSPDGAMLYFRSEQPTVPTTVSPASDGVERLYQVATTTFLHPGVSAGAALTQPMTETAAPIPLTAAPQLVGPGTVSTAAEEFKATVAPDGATLVFVVTDHQFRHMTLVESHLSNGEWGPPVVAAFSGIWRDGDPSYAPDGRSLVFISNRPLPGDRAGTVHRDFNIWQVPYRADGTWGEPTALSRSINSDASELAPSLTRSGVLYFSRGEQILCAARRGDGFAPPEPLPFAGGDPAVAPDDSFLVFDRDGPSAGDTELFASCRTATGWTPPRPLVGLVSSPFAEGDPAISSDGRTLYFFSDRFAPAPDRAPRTTRATYQEIAREALDNVYNGSRNIYRVDITGFRCSANQP